MKFIIISGLSGSGKSTALQALEDNGFYCVDNIPITLLEQLFDQVREKTTQYKGIAVSIDARNITSISDEFSVLFNLLKNRGLSCSVIFLEASLQTLINRYNATRRKHPLTNAEVSLIEAIKMEKELLNKISDQSDVNIDTSKLSVHEIRLNICSIIINQTHPKTVLLFESFGFKNGIPKNADYIFDVRCLPNPYWDEVIQDLSGLDKPVATFLEKEAIVEQMFADIKKFIGAWIPKFLVTNRPYLTIAVGCTGGKHRSVYISQKLYDFFCQKHQQVQIRHRDISL